MSTHNSRNAVFLAAGIKLAIFTTISIFVTGLLAVIMGNIGLGSGRTYEAIFTNWVLDNFQMAAAPIALLHSKNAAVKGSANRSSVAIPELDRAIDQRVDQAGMRVRLVGT